MSQVARRLIEEWLKKEPKKYQFKGVLCCY